MRIGFVKNLYQSIFLIKKGGILLNNKTINSKSTQIKENDLLLISYYITFFFRSLSYKKKDYNFFFFFNFLKKKKLPFYLELNQKIQACILLYKPSPRILDLNQLVKFNFFFYKFFFFFLKKKTF